MKNKIKTILILIFSTIFLGCTSTSQTVVQPKKTIWEIADSYVKNGAYQEAWSMLTQTPSNMTDKTNAYLLEHPYVYEAGKNKFSISNLENSKKSGFKSSFVYDELDEFKRFAKPDDKKKAEKNVVQIFGKRPVITTPNIYAATTKKTVAAKYGRVAGVQIINRSHINTGAGAQFGAAAGQALYLDNTSWGNYSAAAQIGAGLLGAVIGSAMDTPTSIQFERKYWVTLNDGNTVTVTTTGTDNTHIPQGICVEVVSDWSIETTNESNCKNNRIN